MRLLKYLARNINILNLLLAALTLVILVDAVSPLLSVKVGYKARPSVPSDAPFKTEQPLVLPTPLDYTIVAEENLFHPERRIPLEKKEEALLPKPELVLYGTIVTGDVTLAYVEDKKAPYTTPGRGKRPRVLKKGDAIGGFVLKEIDPTKITLVRNDEVMVVNLDASKERGEGQGKTPPKTPTGAATPGAPPQRSVLSPLAVNRTGVPQAVPTLTAPTPSQLPQMPGARR
jgi:hypothetical protein